jgi:uncharacterized protein
MISGTRDQHTPIEETRALFAAAAAPKELWAVDGAAHVNLHRFAGAEYERRVSEFLSRYLSPIGSSSPIAQRSMPKG